MTSPERLAELSRMRETFEYCETTDTLRVEILKKVQSFAEEETPKNVCSQCKQVVIEIPYEYALIEGHCYSAMGMREFFISRVCEYCFDKMHKFAPDDGVPDVGPRD